LSATLTIDMQDVLGALAQDLHDFMAGFSVGRLSDRDWKERARLWATDMGERMAEARTALEARKAAVAPKLDELSRDLKAFAAELSESPAAERVKQLADQLSFHYEDLRRYLKERKASIALKKLKPINYKRNVFHVLMGTSAVAIFELLLTYTQAIWILAGLSTVVITLESLRRISPRLNDFLIDVVFKPIVRPRERREINSASWYTVSLTLMFLIAPIRAVEVGVLVLAWGDPAANVVGKLWGRVKLWKEKSVLGTSAFFVVAALVGLGFLALVEPTAPFAWRLGLASFAAGVGAVAELFSDRLDDNFTVLVLSAGAAALAFF